MDLVVTRPFAIPPAEDHLQGELLFADSIFVIAGIENPWARRHRIKLADLINEPWALPPPEEAGIERPEAQSFEALTLMPWLCASSGSCCDC